MVVIVHTKISHMFLAHKKCYKATIAIYKTRRKDLFSNLHNEVPIVIIKLLKECQIMNLILLFVVVYILNLKFHVESDQVFKCCVKDCSLSPSQITWKLKHAFIGFYCINTHSHKYYLLIQPQHILDPYFL